MKKIILSVFLFSLVSQAFSFDYVKKEKNLLKYLYEVESLVLNKRKNLLMDQRNLFDDYEHNLTDRRNIKSFKEDLVESSYRGKLDKEISKAQKYCRDGKTKIDNVTYGKIKKLDVKIIKLKENILRLANKDKSKMSDWEKDQFRYKIFKPLKKHMEEYNNQNESQKKLLKELFILGGSFKCDTADIKKFMSKVNRYNNKKVKSLGSKFTHIKHHVYYDEDRCTLIGFYPKESSLRYERKQELRKYLSNARSFRSKIISECLSNRNMKKSDIKLEEFKAYRF